MDQALVHLTDQPWLALAIALCVMLGAAVQVSLGMGFGLVVAPLLALLDPDLVPAPTLFVGLYTAAWAAWRERAAIRWTEVGVAVTGRIAGVVLAVLLLSRLTSSDTFSVLFGVLIGAAVALSVVGGRVRFGRRSILLGGVASGVMGTITSVGAPPMALVYQSRPAGTARPTLSTFFAFGSAASLCGLYLAGWADRTDFLLSVLMLPAMLLGTLAARQLGHAVDRRFRTLMLVLSGAASLVLVARGLA